MFKVEAHTIIDAPVDIVWETLVNYAQYEKWSTMLFPLDITPPQLGATIHLQLSIPDSITYDFKPEIIKLDKDKHYAWIQKTGFSGVFDGEHHFVLTALNDNQTELYNYEIYSGILSPIFKRLPMMKGADAGFEAINQEIKQWSESKVTSTD